MITNDRELAVVLRQIEHLDAILEGFRRDILPKNEKMYGLFSEAPRDMREEMQADVDAYLATKTAPVAETPRPATTDQMPV
jgi:hypothetical protein